MYDLAVEFCSVFINEIVVSGCIVLSDGFLSV